MTEETRVTETKDGQHIHVHIHMGNNDSQKEKPPTETLKGGGNNINIHVLLLIIIASLGYAVASKYGLLDTLPIPDNIANFHLNNLSPFPKAALTLPTPTMQPVTMRCVALKIGIDMNGQPVPASDANIDSIPKQVCHKGCKYEVIPSQAWVGLENGMMSYSGKFMPIGETCSDNGLPENGIQKTFLTVIPLYMLKDYLLGEEKPGDKESQKGITPTLPDFKVPFVEEKIKEAKKKIGAWLWGVSRLVILVIAVIVFLTGLLSSGLSRLILILGSLSIAWYVY